MPRARHHFTIESSFANVAELADRIGTLVGGHPRGGGEAADALRLCLAEAMNNIVEHAYGGVEGWMIHADVTLEPNRCSVDLIDEGRPMPGGMLPIGEVDLDLENLAELPEGGFGWMLIRAEMDEIGYERREGCNVLSLAKRLGA